MGADNRSHLAGGHAQRSDIKAGFRLDFVVGFPDAFNHDDALQTGPVMAVAEPVIAVDDRCRTGYDAAVIAVAPA